MDMVSEKKKRTLEEVSERIEKNPVVGIVDMHNLPARQLFHIKQQLKGKAVIRMVKKRVIMLALERSKRHGIKGLEGKIQNQPALLFSDANPFELANTIAKSVSKANAKAGDIAPCDIVIPAGPTNLPPGPAIGELQKIKIPAGVEGDKIVVKKDTRVAKEGEEISADTADVLAKLRIEPMEITLNLVAVWDSGTVYDKDILFIPPEHYINQLKSAYSNAFNFALNIDYMTSDTVPMLLSKGHQQAYSLSMEAGILTGETIGPLLSKAKAQASALQGLVKDEVPEEPSGPEQPEEPVDKKPEDKEEGGEPAAEQPEGAEGEKEGTEGGKPAEDEKKEGGKKDEPAEGKPPEEGKDGGDEKEGKKE